MNRPYEKPSLSEPIKMVPTLDHGMLPGDTYHCGSSTSSALSMEFFATISEEQWLQ